MKQIQQILIQSILFIIVLVIVGVLIYKNKSLKEQNAILVNNNKAYEGMLDDSNKEKKAFLLTIEQLEYSKDSVIQKLNKVRKDNKILNKQVKELQYIASQARIVDTLKIKDSIFVENTQIDTTINNKWYSIGLSLTYPNSIGLDIKIPSEKTVIISNKKETIDPPKKCWLGRLFQKKHIVTNVTVDESNPYIETTNIRYVEIKE